MKPALEPGSCVIVKTGAPIDRGSIITFRHPVRPEIIVISRLIGLPGDEIRLKTGQIHLNGTAVPQVPTTSYEQVLEPEGPAGSMPRCGEPAGLGATCRIPRLIETLPNGISYAVLNLDPAGPFDDVGPFTVPPNHVFVLGDHRDGSIDSRVSLQSVGLGFIPAASIIGPVTEIAAP